MDEQRINELQGALSEAYFNSWGDLLPEVLLGVLALALLVLEVALPRARRDVIPRVAISSQLIILLLSVATLGQQTVGQEGFFGMVFHSLRGEVMRLFFLVCSILVCHLGNAYLERRGLRRTEFFHTVVVITAALMLLVQSYNFVMLFVALETVTIGFYVLVSYWRGRESSLEAGLKYLVLGALSSAVMLFGIVLLYGVAGDPSLPGHTGDPLNFGQLGAFIAAHPDNTLVLVGAALVVAGLAFKIGAVPFQIWIPDVYQGAPTPVTAFLAVASKGGGFVVLVNLVTGPFAALDHLLVPLLASVAVVTILFGNLAALTQRNIKRLVGLSGIAHAGYLLVGVIAAFSVPWAGSAVVFYLFTYLLASFGLFYVVNGIGPVEDAEMELDDCEELLEQRPLLGSVLIISLGSLAGIPPLAGFIAKAVIFIAAFRAELYLLVGVSAFGVVLSIYYYFGWILTAVARAWRFPGEEAEEDAPRWPEVSSPQRVVMGTLAFLSVALGFYQGVLAMLV